MSIKDAFQAAYRAAGWTVPDVVGATQMTTTPAMKIVGGGGMRAETYQRLRNKLPHFADLVDGKATVVDGTIVPIVEEARTSLARSVA